MNSRSQKILRDALALPADERADVVVELIASLEESDTDPTTVEQEWAREAERRARRVSTSESMGTPWKDLRSRAESHLRK